MPGAVGLWAALLWYGAASEVSWLFLLAAWVLVLGAAAAAYEAWNRRGLALGISVRSGLRAEGSPAGELPEQVLRTAPGPTPLFEGDGAELEIGLETRGASRGPAWVSGRIGGLEVTLATGLVPRRGWRRGRRIHDLRRGPLGATDWRIGTSDPVGFFVSRRNVTPSDVALVLPRFASLANRVGVRELEAAAAAPRAGSGNDLFGVREYRGGDPLRRIHWRSTARHGELVVREYEPPGIRTVCIVLDPAPPTVEVADQIARIAASEAWDCLHHGGRVWIWAPGLEPTASPRDLWAQLEWLARYPDCPPGRTDRPVHREDTVVVTAAPDLLRPDATRNWLVGDAKVDAEVGFERVGTAWPL